MSAYDDGEPRSITLGDLLGEPDEPRVAGLDLEDYLDQFDRAWRAVANPVPDPMPHNWRRHVAMLHACDVPHRELLGYINTVCAPDFDARWCCTDCSFAHVVELCHVSHDDLAAHRFGLENWEART